MKLNKRALVIYIRRHLNNNTQSVYIYWTSRIVSLLSVVTYALCTQVDKYIYYMEWQREIIGHNNFTGFERMQVDVGILYICITYLPISNILSSPNRVFKTRPEAVMAATHSPQTLFPFETRRRVMRERMCLACKYI